MSEATAHALPAAPRSVGPRAILLATTALASAWAVHVLEIGWDQILPGRDDLGQLRSFAAAALRPALAHAESSPIDEPLLAIVLESLARTVGFAAAGMSLAVVGGVILGLLGTTAWWEDDPVGASSRGGRFLRRAVAPAIYGTTRVVTALMRSVHELVWALLFLASFGLTDLSAVLAIAIPYAGTLAKVYSEALDEAPRSTAATLRGAGATPGQALVLGLVPRALPDISAYTLYRFECAVRSSAILGFFGWQTLGYHLRLEWGMADYREVWTFLYALLILVVLLDLWSGGLRRRWVA